MIGKFVSAGIVGSHKKRKKKKLNIVRVFAFA